MERMEAGPAAPKKRVCVKSVLRVIGITVAGAAGAVVLHFTVRFVLPALVFIGIIFIAEIGAPTQDALIPVVGENIELLDQAVAEMRLLDGDTIEISTYQNTQDWRREDLGSIRGMYLHRDNGNAPDTYEPLENDTFERVLDLRYVESIHLEDGGFSLYCGSTGIVPSGAEYRVTYEPGLLTHLQSHDTIGHWPCKKQGDGWLVSYGGDDALLIVPVTDEWFVTKEVW